MKERRINRKRVSGGCFLSPLNGHAWPSHIMHAQQYKSAKGLHHRSLWSGMWPIKTTACSLHVHCVSRKNGTTKQQDRKNSLSALFSLILDSLLTACAALFWALSLSPSLQVVFTIYATILSFCRFSLLVYVLFSELLSVILSPNINEKVQGRLCPWQATAIPSFLMLMIINYMSLTNMPRVILPHLSCAIDFTFWI